MSRSTRSKSKYLIVATQQTVTNGYEERKFENTTTLNKLTDDVKAVLKPGRPVLVRLAVSGEGHSFVVRITDDGLEYIDHVDAGFVPIEVNSKKDRTSAWWEVGYFINRLADAMDLAVSCVAQDPAIKATKAYKKKDKDGLGPCALYAGLFIQKHYGISDAEVASLLPPE